MGNTSSWGSSSGGFSFSSPAASASGSLKEPSPPSTQDQHFFLDCAKRGDFATVRRLIDTNDLYINVQPLGRWSALHWAAKKGKKETVEWLLERNADPSAVTRREGWSAADVARAEKRPDIQALLQRAGAPLVTDSKGGGKGGSKGDSRGGKGGKGKPDMRDSMLPLETVAMVHEVAPKRSKAEIAEAVRNAGGDLDLAMEALLANPPSIADEPEKWFEHFDISGDGLLQKHEVIEALWYSLKEEETKANLDKLMSWKWPEFDWDGEGALDFKRFTVEGGLRDFILERWRDQLAPEPEFLECEDEGGPPSTSTGDGPKAGAAALEDARKGLEDDGVLAVLFTARLLNDFTGLLRHRYRRYREQGLHFEVLFVSMDADRAAFEAYGGMDWMVVPFSSHGARRWLAEKLEVRSVPQLVLLDKEGAVISRDARAAVTEDLDGSNFPWRPPPEPEPVSVEVAEEFERKAEAKAEEGKDRRKMRSVVQSLIGRKASSEVLVDDVSLARTAARAPLTEEGYKQVAAFKSNYAMKRFAQRIVATKQWVVLDNAELTKLIWEHSGIHKSQSLEKLLKDLRGALGKWLVEAEEGAEDVTSLPLGSLRREPAAAPAAEAADAPSSALPMLGLRTQAFRHAFISQKAVGAMGSRKSSMASMAHEGIAEGDEAEDGPKSGSGLSLPTGASSGGSTRAEEASTRPAVTLLVPGGPPPPPEDSETEEEPARRPGGSSAPGAAAAPLPPEESETEEEPSGKGAGASLTAGATGASPPAKAPGIGPPGGVKGPPGGVKGRGKGSGTPPPLPHAEGGAAPAGVAAGAAAGESPAAAAGGGSPAAGGGGDAPAAAPAPGKGAGPKGKHKGPPPPGDESPAADDAGGEAAGGEGDAPEKAAAPVKGAGPKGKKGAPPAGPGKAPGRPPGKGPGGPPGKGPPPKGGGKGKGAKGGPEPTREEIDEWKDKKKNPLRWKRLLQDDGLFDDSLFADAEGEGEVDDEHLLEFFAKEAKEAEEAEAVVEKELEMVKPILWGPTEKQSQTQRLQDMGIKMKAWPSNTKWVFLERLRSLDLNGIRLDKDFRDDRFEMLTDLVDQITDADWQKLCEKDADKTYVWNKDIEGFFLELKNVPSYKDRLAALQLGLMVEKEVSALASQAKVLHDGMEEVLKSDVLGRVFRKILHIGNRLNAGETKFCRADGFDVVALLEATDFLRAYKGQGQVNLLKFLTERELNEEMLQELVRLASNLKAIEWQPRPPSVTEDTAPDPTDLGELRKRSNDVSRNLGVLENYLDGVLLMLGSAMKSSESAEPATPVAAPSASFASTHSSSFSSPAKGEAASPATEDFSTPVKSDLAPPAGISPLQEAQLRQMEEFSGQLETYKSKSIQVESDLDLVEESLKRLHRLLAHQPPKNKELVAGHSLGVVAFFVRMLAAAQREGKRKRSSVPSRRSPA